MNVGHLTPADICGRLRDGWNLENFEVPRELLNRLCIRWQANLELEESVGFSAYRAALELNRVRLLGALDFGCLVLGKGANVKSEVANFWQQQGGIGRMALILAATQELKEAARKTAPIDHCVFLANGEIEQLLTEQHPLELLKKHIRTQIPIRRLVPYDVMHPVTPNMFFGRRNLLERFLSEETTSFAIAGPGRIGKSSLLRQYRYELRQRQRDSRRDRLVFIDCYPFGGFTDDALARRIALEISAHSDANRVNRETLLRFLKRHSREGREPVELLLDEVDCVCLNPAFQELGEAVRCGYCRVILCGRGNLHRMMRQKDTQFVQRLELIQPEPLDEQAAGRLLVEPLTDLGLVFQDMQELRNGVLELTRRRPQLIQACAKRLVELAVSNETNIITQHHLECIRAEFGAMACSTLALDDLQDNITRLITLLVLRTGLQYVTVGSLHNIAEMNHVCLSASKAMEICYDLWICNLLVWERGVFVVASPHLVEFVRKMDFNAEIERLKRIVNAPTFAAA
jgi:hypothetical protein